MTLPSSIEGSPDRVAEIRQRYRIVEFAVFGSTARVDLCPGSDIDIYLKFEAGTHPGMGYFGLEDELRLFSAGRWIWGGNHYSSPWSGETLSGLSVCGAGSPTGPDPRFGRRRPLDLAGYERIERIATPGAWQCIELL